MSDTFKKPLHVKEKRYVSSSILITIDSRVTPIFIIKDKQSLLSIHKFNFIIKDEDGRRAGGRRRIGGKDCSSSGGGTGPPSGLSSAGIDHLGNDGESSSGWSPKSRDDSRASSIEKEVGNIHLSSDPSNSNSALQTPTGKVCTFDIQSRDRRDFIVCILKVLYVIFLY